MAVKKSIFYPDVYINSIFDIDYAALSDKAVKNLIFDIDNTLEPYFVPEPSIKVIKLFKKLKIAGFSVCLLSNNSENRAKRFNKKLGLKYVSRAVKPLPFGLNKALGHVNGQSYNTVLIGDQIFTDVLCGRLNGIYTILVKPISEKDEFFVRIKRRIEIFVINKYLKSVENIQKN